MLCYGSHVTKIQVAFKSIYLHVPPLLKPKLSNFHDIFQFLDQGFGQEINYLLDNQSES